MHCISNKEVRTMMKVITELFTKNQQSSTDMTLCLQPDTWDRLKAAMREIFVPPAYQCDLRKKLQCLDQGDMSDQDYYAAMQKGMIHAGVHEETENKICHFYSSLCTKIQDIVDYKKYNTINHLF
jgi:hypothetical protein